MSEGWWLVLLCLCDNLMSRDEEGEGESGKKNDGKEWPGRRVLALSEVIRRPLYCYCFSRLSLARCLHSQILKQQKLQEGAPYAYALVDFIREKVGNTRVEPPGLFRGRGEHPKQGMLKVRIRALRFSFSVIEVSGTLARSVCCGSLCIWYVVLLEKMKVNRAAANCAYMQSNVDYSPSVSSQLASFPLSFFISFFLSGSLVLEVDVRSVLRCVLVCLMFGPGRCIAVDCRNRQKQSESFVLVNIHRPVFLRQSGYV